MIEKFQQKKTSGGPAAGGTTTSGGPILEGKFGNLVGIRKCYFNIFFSAGRAQPDNREGDENCLAVLNNFYDDGIR